ncbi:Ribosomal Protein Lateral Stalk Subunit P2-like, partial [Chelydra serpentina]
APFDPPRPCAKPVPPIVTSFSERGAERAHRFGSVTDLKMRYVAAYLLAVLGGNNNPTAKNIKKILNSVGIDADDECVNKVISELNGKDVDDVVNSGLSKLACVPAGSAVAAAPATSPAAGEGAPAEEKKEEEKKEESEESDEDMGFGLFD